MRLSVLLIVTVAALAAVLVLRSLPQAADRALELQTGSMNRREQAQRHTNIAARERRHPCAAHAVVAVLSMCALTLLCALIADAANCMHSASLHTQQQVERASVRQAQCSMRASSLHVSALLSPSIVLSCIALLQPSECAAEAAAGRREISHSLWISTSNNNAHLHINRVKRACQQ